MEQEIDFYKELLKQEQHLSEAQKKRTEELMQEVARTIQQYKDTIGEYEELCGKQQERLQQYQEGLGMDFTLREEEKEKSEPN